MDWVPFVPLVPVHPPLAVHEVALVADQFKVLALPLVTVLGLPEKVTVGADALTDTVADCAAVPPAPVQLNE